MKALLAVLLTVSLCACAQPAKQDDGMAADSVALAANQTRTVQTLAGDQTFLSFYTADDTIGGIAAEIAGLNLSDVEHGYIVRVTGAPTDILKGMMGEDAADMSFDLSEAAATKVNGTVSSMFANFISASQGSYYVAASSVLQSGFSCQKPKDYIGDHTVVLIFQNGWASFTTITESKEDTLAVSTMMACIPEQWRDAADADSIKDMISQYLPSDFLEVEAIGEEQLKKAFLAESAG